MALGKIYTLKSVVDTVLLWLQEELQSDLEPNIVKDFVNLSVFEVAEKVSVNTDDYGKTLTVTDVSNNKALVVTGNSYTDATKTINKTAHGLTDANIGDRLILYDNNSEAGIYEIASIPDVDNIVIKEGFGTDIAAGAHYAVLSQYATPYIDISGIKVMNIVKLRSSTIKEIKKLGDVEADNIERNDFKTKNNAFWYKHGEIIHLVLPSDVGLGTLTLFYNTYPEKKTDDTDYLDIRDNYIPEVIQKTKEKCLEFLGIVNYKFDTTPDLNGERKKSINVENRTGIDG